MSMTTSPTAVSTSTSNSMQFPGLGAGREELMKYFATSAGIEFLSQPEYLPAFELYQRNGLLSRLLHRPDWPFLATSFRDLPTEPIPFQASIVDNFTTFDSLKQFFEKGWTTVSNVTTPEHLQNAKKIIHYWQYKYLPHNTSSTTTTTTTTTTNTNNNGVRKHRGYSVELVGDIAGDMHLLALYYQSPLPHIMQQLFGADEVEHPKFCRVMVVYPSLDLTESPALFGDKWSIDGFTTHPASHSPYNLLIGIALTDMMDIDMGNFCVHSGSHLLLLEEYKAKAEQGSTIFSENPYTVTKPDLGPPTQVKLRAGDAFFCTQRLATLFATNTSASPVIFAFFEISHVDHRVLKDPALQSLWLEYKNASIYLGDENAGIIVTKAIARPLETSEDLLDLSAVHLQEEGGQAAGKASGTVAATPISPVTVMPSPSAASTAGLYRNPSQSQSQSNAEEYTPAINPMFSSNPSGYASVARSEEEDYGRESLGPSRPSNHIPLQTFASNTNHPNK